MSRLPAYSELPVTEGAPPGSSWGVWGSDDKFGALNLLTPEAVARGLRAARSGEVVSLNASLRLFEKPLFGREQFRHDLSFSNGGFSCDETLSSFNTQCSSQLDGFGHVGSIHYGHYNGLSREEHSMGVWAERGIAGRGVVLDLASPREDAGRPIAYDGPDPVTVDDVRTAIAAREVAIEPGDILVLHTGWLDWARAEGGRSPAFPGLRPGRDMLELLWNLHPAIVASDTPSVEVWPKGVFSPAEEQERLGDDPSVQAGYFMHPELIALLGIPLGEMWDTGRLAERCRARGDWTFLLTCAPLNLPGGVASTANVLAVL